MVQRALGGVRLLSPSGISSRSTLIGYRYDQLVKTMREGGENRLRLAISSEPGVFETMINGRSVPITRSVNVAPSIEDCARMPAFEEWVARLEKGILQRDCKGAERTRPPDAHAIRVQTTARFSCTGLLRAPLGRFNPVHPKQGVLRVPTIGLCE